MDNKFLFKVIIAAFLGIIAGLFIPASFSLLGIPALGVYNLLGQLFLRALTLMVVPLVTASIITGAMRLGEDKSLGRLGGKILLTFACTMACAIAIGMIFVLTANPGAGIPVVDAPEVVLDAVGTGIQTTGSSWDKVEMIFFRVVPSNVLGAASQGEILGVILFASLFGIFSAEAGGSVSATLKAFWESTFNVLIRMTQFVMKFLPFGVFGLIAKATATTGSAAIFSVGAFALTVLLALFFYAFCMWPLALWLLAKVNPWKHLKAMWPALLTGFTTSSSAATLPVALECVEKESGVSNRVSGLVLSLGIAINLSGSALYAAAVVTFIAQLTGAPLDTGSVVFMYIVSLLTCFGMAGIPSASLIAIVLILQTLNIPSDQLALIMAIERFVDMLRTAINVFANSCCAVLVARWEGEETAIALGGKNG